VSSPSGSRPPGGPPRRLAETPDRAARRLAAALDRAEQAVADGKPLDGTGFWSAVAAARRDPLLAERFADRIATIDRASFEAFVPIRVPAAVGVLALAAGTAAGIAAVTLVPAFGRRTRVLVFLAGLGALEVSTHSLAHWAVGRAVGIRFTHAFLGGPPPPRPGLKIDYGSYLRVAPRARAAMHASGALVTKAIPFALLPVARADRLPRWVSALLLVLGGAQLATDVAFSTKSSDWKKVRRELRAARRRH
jgi:hypothetical protein